MKTRWSLERQVRTCAGLLVLTGAVLAFTVNVNWLFLSAFVGLGLTFAGVTDICFMAEVLEKMPVEWTKPVQDGRSPRGARAGRGVSVGTAARL